MWQSNGFPKINASSAVKKAAYAKGCKQDWKWERLDSQYPDQPFVRIYAKGKDITITGVEAEFYQDYTWEELRKNF